MIRKNQLKSFSLQKLEQFSLTQKDGQILIMIDDVIKQRNQLLKNKRNELNNQLLRVRKQTNKTIKQMNQGVKERLNKKEKVIMDKCSRPTQQDIKGLTQLYNYMEKQSFIIDRNNKDIERVLEMKQSEIQSLKNPLSSDQEKFNRLDKEYERLNQECEKQEKRLKQKKQQLTSFKTHIDNIHSTIQQYRVKYQVVESQIRQKQRQLDHLVTYFKNRTKQDQENIERQRKLSHMLQTQMLKAQSIFNFSNNTNQELKIKQIQCSNEL